jgi:hypothetical protein
VSVLECPRCWTAGQWTATGRTGSNARGLTRAQLHCGKCGYLFWSGWPVALEAAAAATPPAEPTGRSPAPAPTLPHSMTTRQPDMVRVGDVQSRVIADFRRRQSGERE